MEEKRKVIIQHFENGSKLTFIPAGIDSKDILGFSVEDMKETKCIRESILNNQGNCIGSKFITSSEL